MNRHDRRAEAARQRNIERHSALYESYLRYLPQIPIDAPLQVGLEHLVFQHDNWCRFFDTNKPSDCNCNPVIKRYREPIRS